jgi:hypothetical protein
VLSKVTLLDEVMKATREDVREVVVVVDREIELEGEDEFFFVVYGYTRV